MSNILKKIIKHFKPLLSLLLAAGIFFVCLWPLRPLLNWHEQQHLFRWTSSYISEQWASPGGLKELIVSFITQFFYVGWIGALLISLLAVLLQLFVWQLMKWCRLGKNCLYPLSLIPSLLFFYLVFIPSPYRKDPAFKESVTYDYLMRSHQWDKIVQVAQANPPTTLHGKWCMNYALAMRGQLNDLLFLFPQSGPDGLIEDGRHVESLPLFALSDIFLQLGCVNDAERIAFDALQLMPDHHKSGRLYQRLWECNMLNGDTVIAQKYRQILSSTLFYSGQIEDTKKINTYRVASDSLLTPLIPHKLKSLITEHPDNRLAQDYLLAYQLLRLDFNGVLEAELMVQKQAPRVAPRAVQECIIGNWVLTHPNDSFPIPLSRNIFDQTMKYMQTVNRTGNMLDPSLSTDEHLHSYWHYYAVSQQNIKKKP